MTPPKSSKVTQVGVFSQRINQQERNKTPASSHQCLQIKTESLPDPREIT